MALGADDVETTFGGNSGSKLDVRSATGHVRGDGYGPGLTGVCNDVGLTFVLFGVQHLVLDALAQEECGEVLGFLDRGGTDQDRPFLLVHCRNLFDDSGELRPFVEVDDVLLIVPDHRPMGGNDDDLEAVDLGKLFRLGFGGSGHAGEFVVDAKEVLEGDGGVGD